MNHNFVWQKAKLLCRRLSAISNRPILGPVRFWCPKKADRIQEEIKPDISIKFLLWRQLLDHRKRGKRPHKCVIWRDFTSFLFFRHVFYAKNTSYWTIMTRHNAFTVMEQVLSQKKFDRNVRLGLPLNPVNFVRASKSTQSEYRTIMIPMADNHLHSNLPFCHTKSHPIKCQISSSTE